jgi:hypothetical protein
MIFSVDFANSKLRHEEMLRMANNARLARLATASNGADSLLSRMVKLLARSNRQLQSAVQSEEPNAQHPLANAKMG